jgi:hypothetical protein
MPYPLFSFSADSLRKAAACNFAARCQEMEEHLGHLLRSDEPLSTEIWWNLPSTSEKDMVWSLRLDPLNCPFVCVDLGLFFASRVLPVYEHLFPKDERLHTAIEAAQAWQKTLSMAAIHLSSDEAWKASLESDNSAGTSAALAVHALLGTIITSHNYLNDLAPIHQGYSPSYITTRTNNVITYTELTSNFSPDPLITPALLRTHIRSLYGLV